MTAFAKLVDLACERLGGRVIQANDEFFAPKSNLLKASKPVFIEGKFTSRGKWMDGWETRRRRMPGYDWCIIRLGLPGIVRGVVVDTTHFKGNYPARFSLDALDLGGCAPYSSERLQLKKSDWVELLPETALAGDSLNAFSVSNDRRFTHVRLNIYPDGGVARLRVHGEVVPDLSRLSRADVDLASIINGGRILGSSDEFFGVPLNLLLPGRGKNMGDGWETRRRRGPGHDWTIVKLGIPGQIRHAEVDTAHFKGNFPESCSLDALSTQSDSWMELLPRTKLKADSRHHFRKQLLDIGPVTQVRLNIYPDGGVSRLRLFGRPVTQTAAPEIGSLNRLTRAQARKALLDCCGSTAWVDRMMSSCPFTDLEQLLECADRAWSELPEKDQMEAFRYHPPIGSKKPGATQSRKAQRWSAGEQSQAKSAPPEILAQLAEANQAYYAKFGTVFLICATGKSANEILQSLRARLANEWSAEARVAAEQQRQITRLRLKKLISS